VKRLLVPLVAALLLLIPSVARCEDAPKEAEKEPTVKEVKKAADDAQGSADTAWMLVATGLVLLMVPGLALFYGGMVRRKNVLGTMMHSMVALAILGVEWVLIGYALAFGTSQGGLIGWDPRLVGLWSPELFTETFSNTKVPIILHCMYQGMFAIITPALISGAIAERVKFGPYCLFLALWGLVVYVPLAHWVWALDKNGNPVGWLGHMGALDFAGGTVVHVAAGVSGLAAILVLRKRVGYPEHAMHPNSMVLTLVGGGLLWFGWFGFNGGSALGSSGQAVSALAASQVAAAAAVLGWLGVEWLHRGKPTALGLASGLVAGLVVITPASGFVTPLGALAMGLIGGVVCYAAVALKPKLKYDDSLDAFGVHGVGGFLGAVLTGVFASGALIKAVGSDPFVGKDGGLVFDRNGGQVVIQLFAAVIATAWAFLVSLALVKGIDVVFGFTSDPKAEGEGLDRTEHGEVGFDLGLAMEATPETPPPSPRPATVPPNGKRHFTVVLEGAKPQDLLHAWSELCQAGVQPSPEFRDVYPYLTTVQGNRFRFRGGDPGKLRYSMQKLFQDKLDGAAVVAHVED
jgi:ammonium transporter, Amt family